MPPLPHLLKPSAHAEDVPRDSVSVGRPGSPSLQDLALSKLGLFALGFGRKGCGYRLWGRAGDEALYDQFGN